MIYQVWMHTPSGCLYAVGFKEYTNPVATASDALTSDEVEAALLEGFEDDDPETASWINEHSDSFVLYAYVHEGKVILN